MLQLHTRIEIAAPAALVWKILVDFPRYAEWNPLLPQAAGEARPGGILEVVIHPPGCGPAPTGCACSKSSRSGPCAGLAGC